MNQATKQLTAAVLAQATVLASAVALITGLSDQLKTATAKLADAGADTSELVELTNQITTHTEELADAVRANTVAQHEDAPVTTNESALTENTDPASPAEPKTETSDPAATTDTTTENPA